jgi:uncharacterized damage-inducible protein DinB
MNYSLEHHLAYSVWANEILVDRLKKLDETVLHQEVKSSFPSIAKTLLHMWDAEVVWMKRFQGISLTDWPSKNFTGSTTDLLNGFLKSSRDLQAFVSLKGGAFVKETIRYKNLKGTEFEDPIEPVLYHVVNHGSYHRGQITTMLRELGVTDPVGTDIILYWRSLKK